MMPLFYALLSLVGGWFGGFFRAYFNKKGENLATKEDIAQITHTVKNIEARISNEMFFLQRNWQAKQDVAYELMRETASFQESVLGLLAFWNAMHNTPEMMNVPNPEAATALDNYKKCTANLWRAKLVAALLLREQVISRVDEVERAGRIVVNFTQLPKAPPEEVGKSVLALRQAQEGLISVVRESLLDRTS